jgi:hypothetical protein
MSKAVIYSMFLSYDGGHILSLHTNLSVLALKITEMEDDFGTLEMSGKSRAERTLNLFGELQGIKPGQNEFYEFKDNVWVTVGVSSDKETSEIKKHLSQNQ